MKFFKELKTSEKRLLVAIGIFLPIVIYMYFPGDDEYSSQGVVAITTPPPESVSVQSFSAVNSEQPIKRTAEEIELKSLEHAARVAQLNAIIAEATDKAGKAAIDKSKSEAEIKKLNSDMENEAERVRLERMRIENESAEIKSRKVEENVSRLQMQPVQSVQAPELPKPELTSPKKAENPKPTGPTTSHVLLNMLKGSGAVFSVDGNQFELNPGDVANGIKLVGTDSIMGTALIKHIKSGRQQVLKINTMTSRNYARLRSFDDDKNDDTPSEFSIENVNPNQGGNSL